MKILKRNRERGLDLYGFGLNKFAQNLIASIRELWIIGKSFCGDVLQKTSQLKECKLYLDSGVLTTENDTFSGEHDVVCPSSRQKNDCYYKEVKIKLDIDGSVKFRNSYPNNLIIGISKSTHCKAKS